MFRPDPECEAVQIGVTPRHNPVENRLSGEIDIGSIRTLEEIRGETVVIGW